MKEATALALVLLEPTVDLFDTAIDFDKELKVKGLLSGLHGFAP